MKRAKNYSLKQIKTASDALGFASIAAMSVDLNIAYSAIRAYSEGDEIRQAEQIRLEEVVNYGLNKAEGVVK